ncbi:MAG: putative diguanylate cyclase/phosphodiesterase with sensor [Chloroflexi bacterium]|nr:putative diguanylate cyclase/phosphodiesterase with sensor [Chloroflexota bacterium]
MPADRIVDAGPPRPPGTGHDPSPVRRRRALPVWALTAGILLGAAVLHLTQTRHLPGMQAPVHIPWYALALFFMIAEWWRVCLYFRSSAHSFSLSEMPLVVGLFLTDPSTLVLARVLGALVAMGLLRRQPPLKLLFNIGLFGLEAEVAAIAVGHLLPGGAPLAPAAWAVVLLAVAAVSVLGVALIMLAVTLSEGRPPGRTMVQGLLFQLLAGVTNASLALLAVFVVWRDVHQLWLLLAPVGTLVAGYAAYGSERQRHQRMQHLYETSELLQRTPADGAATSALLAQLCRVFQAEVAEVTLLPPHGGRNALSSMMRRDDFVETDRRVDISLLDELVHFAAEDQRGVRLSTRESTMPAVLRSRHLKDAMFIALRSESRIIGTMLVGNRLGDLETFNAEDLALFETLAGQASVAFENGRLEDRLKHQAFHDPLTNLPNRTLFSDRLAHALTRRTAAGDCGVALLFIDLDDFKMVNDELGHAAGDQLLRAVGERLVAVLRPFDTTARLGGDEFAVLVEDAGGVSAAARIAERIVESLREPFLLQGRELAMHASIGVALAGDEPVDGEELLRRADIAMYRVKQRGKGAFEIYQSSMQEVMVRRLELRTDLERAVQRGELFLRYQPIVALDDEHMVGVEALVRWQHPQRGPMPPNDFIPLAEETGLIVGLGIHVLEVACRQARAWHLAYPHHADLGMSVNLSPRQLQDDGFVIQVARVLRDTGLEPHLLTLEITESFMVDGGPPTGRLNDLKALGVRLSIDDFGTGYSSLSALQHLPVDALKIAKPFVDGIALDPQKRAFAQAIVRLGRTLRLELVAEGVERPEQRDQLLQLGCHMAQGYFFARPMDADGVERLLRTEARERCAGGIAS